MDRFTAFRIHAQAGGAPPVRAALEQLSLDELTPGDVVVRVQWSGINYKDALAATGAGRILRRSPLVGGIDLAGTVVASASADVAVGAAVLVTGCGLSETRDGGYAEYARVPAEAVVPLPPGLSAREAMAIGTAGFTAALAITRMEHDGQHPGRGPVAVTGAAGGVGCLALDMLSRRGYEVIAVTRDPANGEFLRALGANEVLPAAALAAGGDTPLAGVRWGGGIDNVGGDALSALLRATGPNGNVASVGLAGGATLTTSVMPFLLRGVNLLGINSSATERALRLRVWDRIASDLRPRHLGRIVTRTVTLDALPAAFAPLVEGRHRGRTLVAVAPEATA